MVADRHVSTPSPRLRPTAAWVEADHDQRHRRRPAEQQTFTDNGTSRHGTQKAGGPRRHENAVESPWPSRTPYFIAGLEGVGITCVGDDASKAYPNPPDPFGTGPPTKDLNTPASETFTEGKAQVVPRHPINIYYNASTEAQEVDEYNTLFGPDWRNRGQLDHDLRDETADVRRNREKRSSYGHVPERHEQRPAAELRPPDQHHGPAAPAGEPPNSTPLPTTPETTGDGLLYSVLNPLLAEYNKYFATTPRSNS